MMRGQDEHVELRGLLHSYGSLMMRIKKMTFQNINHGWPLFSLKIGETPIFLLYIVLHICLNRHV
jgi:hypothetical protein